MRPRWCQSLAGQMPGTGLSATSVALDGAISHADSFAVANPGAHTAIVLVTGGLPAACDTNMNDIATSAATGYQQSNVLTYVVGIGPLSAYDVVAAAGGTGATNTADPASATLATDVLGLFNNIEAGLSPQCTTCFRPLPTWEISPSISIPR